MRSDARKILVADDHSGIRGLLRMVLQHRGYQVLEAESGPDTLERFVEHDPPVVILDLTMPGLEGFELLARLHALNPQARIVIFSGMDTEQIRSRATLLGASEVFQKGSSLQAVADLVEGYGASLCTPV